MSRKSPSQLKILNDTLDLMTLMTHETMTPRIQTFSNDVFDEIRTMTNEKGETFFVGKDVAKALGYKNTCDALNKHVDNEDKDGVAIRDSIGRGVENGSHQRVGSILPDTLFKA